MAMSGRLGAMLVSSGLITEDQLQKALATQNSEGGRKGFQERKDPLSPKHEEEFTYLKDAKRAIGLLKQAGLSPEEFSQLIELKEGISEEMALTKYTFLFFYIKTL